MFLYLFKDIDIVWGTSGGWFIVSTTDQTYLFTDSDESAINPPSVADWVFSSDSRVYSILIECSGKSACFFSFLWYIYLLV
jgi:hypothetical protein